MEFWKNSEFFVLFYPHFLCFSMDGGERFGETRQKLIIAAVFRGDLMENYFFGLREREQKRMMSKR